MFNGNEDEDLVDLHLSQAGLITLLESEDEDGNCWEKEKAPNDVSTTALQDQHEAWFCPFVPSSETRINYLMTVIGNELNSNDVIYDLGCGDGRVLTSLGQRFHCQCVGVDIDPKLIETARTNVINTIPADLKSLFSWRCDDACTMALDSPAPTVIILYLVPSALLQMETVMKHLWSTLNNLTIITLVYRFKGWHADDENQKEGIFLYHCKDSQQRRPFCCSVATASEEVGSGNANEDDDDDEEEEEEEEIASSGVVCGLFEDMDSDFSSSEEENEETEESGNAAGKKTLSSAPSWRNSMRLGGKHNRTSQNETEKQDEAKVNVQEEKGVEKEETEKEEVIAASVSFLLLMKTMTMLNEDNDSDSYVDSTGDTDSNSDSNGENFEKTQEDTAKENHKKHVETEEDPETDITSIYPDANMNCKIQDTQVIHPSTPLTFHTKLTADSIECCPVPGFTSICVCATYKLEDTNRIGSLLVCDTLLHASDQQTDASTWLQKTWEGSGVLDCKWSTTCGTKRNPKKNVNKSENVKTENETENEPLQERERIGCPLLGSVHANGTLLLHTYDVETNRLQTICEPVGELDQTVFLSLDFNDRLDTSTSSSLRVIVSQADGYLSLWDLGGLSNGASSSAPLQIHRFKAHELTHGYPSEAWIAAFDCWHPNVVISGGDDGKFCGWDLRTSCDRPLFTRQYEAGVCSAQFDPLREHRMAVGGYYGSVDIYDMRKLRSSTNAGFNYKTFNRNEMLNSFQADGGVWRIKWHPKNEGVLIGACMRGGVRIFQDPTLPNELHGMSHHYEGHPSESLAYGVDWDRSNLNTIYSCSFYDSQMHQWKY